MGVAAASGGDSYRRMAEGRAARVERLANADED